MSHLSESQIALSHTKPIYAPPSTSYARRSRFISRRAEHKGVDNESTNND